MWCASRSIIASCLEAILIPRLPFSLEAGPAQLLLAGVSDEVRARVRQAVREALAQHVGSTGVVPPRGDLDRPGNQPNHS
jgi:hypothetical protein